MTAFLDAFKDKFKRYALSYGAGGCDTCGYGADDVISDDDYILMLEEMDEWIKENFK